MTFAQRLRMAAAGVVGRVFQPGLEFRFSERELEGGTQVEAAVEARNAQYYMTASTGWTGGSGEYEFGLSGHAGTVHFDRAEWDSIVIGGDFAAMQAKVDDAFGEGSFAVSYSNGFYFFEDASDTQYETVDLVEVTNTLSPATVLSWYAYIQGRPGGTALVQTVWPMSAGTGAGGSPGGPQPPLDPAPDTPDALALLAAIPEWTADTALADYGQAWGAQGPDGDAVVLVKRPDTDDVWATEGPNGGTTGSSEPDWDAYDPPTVPVVPDGDHYGWWPVDASFPAWTPDSWAPGIDMGTVRLIEERGYLFVSYPGYSGASEYPEPDFAVAAAAGQYVSDGGGYWWPLGYSGEDVDLSRPDIPPIVGGLCVAGDGNLSVEARGFVVGSDAYGSTLTAEYDRDSAMYVQAAWNLDDDRTMYAVWIPGPEYLAGGSAEGEETCPFGWGEDAESGYYCDAYGYADDPEDSYFQPYYLLNDNDSFVHYGAVQAAQAVLFTVIDSGNGNADTGGIAFELSHIDGPECFGQTGWALGNYYYGAGYGGLLVGNYTGGGYCAPGRWCLVEGYSVAHTAAERLATRQRIVDEMAAVGVSITLREEAPPPDLLGPPGAFEVVANWDASDEGSIDAVDGDVGSITDLVGAINMGRDGTPFPRTGDDTVNGLNVITSAYGTTLITAAWPLITRAPYAFQVVFVDDGDGITGGPSLYISLDDEGIIGMSNSGDGYLYGTGWGRSAPAGLHVASWLMYANGEGREFLDGEEQSFLNFGAPGTSPIDVVVQLGGNLVGKWCQIRVLHLDNEERLATEDAALMTKWGVT